MSTDTRTRILDAAGRHFRVRGFGASGIKAILTDSAAPYGSLYHHFPGGKSELGAEVIRREGERYRELVASFFDNELPVDECVTAFFEGAAALLEVTDFDDACPIATLALEVASTDETMRQAASDAFESWIEVVADRLQRDGVQTDVARGIAVQAFCAIEGGFLHARTTRTTMALRQAGQGVVASLRAVRAPDRSARRTRRTASA